VTEGEQGKYGRDGALWKHLSEGALGIQDADATGEQWNHSDSSATDLAANAESG
jgi:hypothetical protein